MRYLVFRPIVINDNPPTSIKTTIINLPKTDSSIETFTTDNPVTHTHEVDMNNASIKPIDLPFDAEIGKTKKRVPINTAVTNVPIIMKYGCILLSKTNTSILKTHQ